MNPCILLPEMEKRFALDTKQHIMEVRKCDGMYRHLYFRNPDYFGNWFEIVTFPTVLVFNGDYGTYCLSGIPDMFEYFRSSEHDPEYWAGKLCDTTSNKVYCYSSREIINYLENEFQKFCDLAGDEWTEEQQQAYRDEFREKIIDNCYEESDFLNIGFQELESGYFFDVCEISPYTLSGRFLWACCAIPWAVAKFDEYQKEHGK